MTFHWRHMPDATLQVIFFPYIHPLPLRGFYLLKAEINSRLSQFSMFVFFYKKCTHLCRVDSLPSTDQSHFTAVVYLLSSALTINMECFCVSSILRTEVCFEWKDEKLERFPDSE